MATYGPVTTYTHYGSPRNYTSVVDRWRQKPIDHRKPLPFNRYVIKTTGNIVHGGDSTDYSSSAEDFVYQVAYNRFRTSVYGQAAALGADLGERKQTVNAIVGRATQLLTAVHHLKRGNLRGMFAAFGLKKPKSVGKLSSDLGGQWLEYSYGWKPLIQDIHDAVDALQQPFPVKLAKGKGRAKYRDGYRYADTTHSLYQYSVYRTLIQAEVEVNNWPVYKATQLGLTNPLSVAWELVPFSFAVDWFIPVGSFLQSLTDFAGLSLRNSFVTIFQTNDLTYWHKLGIQTGTHKWVRVHRTPGSIPLPPITPRFSGFYSARGANAIALLVQGLKNLKL